MARKLLMAFKSQLLLKHKTFLMIGIIACLFLLAAAAIKSFLFYAFLAVATGIVVYFASRCKIMFDVSPFYVVAVIVMAYYGLVPLLLLFVFSSLTPGIIGGSVPDAVGIASLSVLFAIVLIVVNFTSLGFIPLLFFAFVYSLYLGFSVFVLGGEMLRSLTVFFGSLSVNAAYVIMLRDLLMWAGNVAVG